MKKQINIEQVNYQQYQISTEISGETYSTFTTNSQLIDEYNSDDEQVAEMAADKLYDIIYKANLTPANEE